MLTLINNKGVNQMSNELKNMELLKNSQTPTNVKFINNLRCSYWIELTIDSIPEIIKELKALHEKLIDEIT